MFLALAKSTEDCNIAKSFIRGVSIELKMMEELTCMDKLWVTARKTIVTEVKDKQSIQPEGQSFKRQ